MLEPAAAQCLIDNHRRIVVTGAGGWLGLATLDLLERALGESFGDRVVCFGSDARVLELRNGTRIGQQPLSAIAALPQRPSWVLHFAFLTKDRAEHMDEHAYRAANRAIGQTVLDALDVIGADAVFVASSGAAERAEDSVNAAMRLYGAMKLEDEYRFAAWAQADRGRVVIGRIFNVTGPYINKHQAYAFASFILDGLAGRPIEVRAPHRVVRSYVAIDELISLVFLLMGEARCGVTRFDSGGEPLELGEVAAIVAAAFPGGQVARAAITQPGEDRYHGDSAAYAALLDRFGIRHRLLAHQIAETAEWLAQEVGGQALPQAGERAA